MPDGSADRVPSAADGVGKRWRARYVDLAGKEIARGFDRKIDAQHWLDTVTASQVRGDYIDPKLGRTLVGTLAEEWFAAKSSTKWKASTRERNRGLLDNYVLPRWGTTELITVASGDIADWVSGLNDGKRTSGSIHKIAWTLAGVLTYAVARKRLATSPFIGIDLPTKVSAKRVYLTADQVEQLAKASHGNDLVVLTLTYCGLRFGELAALTVGDVLVARRRLSVHGSVTEVNGKLTWGTPKDGEMREIPVPKFLKKMLVEHIEGRSVNQPLFTAPGGGVLRVRNARRDWFDRAAQSIGEPKLTPHGLRHTAASLAISAGGSVLAVQQMLGHDKPSTTLDIYADLFDKDADDLAARLNRVRKSAADELRTNGLDEREQVSDKTV